ncbi:hypothetical protein [uncultured Bacteroides sp.]|uniref:hypothetical protein n=2 Tax=uncultured Bacteroides sp. TaxID=162156 RepID=UPI00262E47CB|nr:hypothetical protein [uncultured Bacteroides sp.]
MESKFAYQIIIGLLFLVSCRSNQERQFDVAMQIAENNRKELEKVLLYYQDEPHKKQAAKFLIANMPFHFAYVANEIDSLKEVLKAAKSTDGIVADTIKRHWKNWKYASAAKVFDVNTITADLLIENIDLAFSAWERRPWSKHYSFEEFCEYILPYRLDNEPLEQWRKIYHDKYATVLDSLYQGTDVVEATNLLKNYIKKEGFTHSRELTIPHQGACFLYENRIGYCRDKTDFLCYALRAAGIPVASDYYYISNMHVGNHNWNALIDTTKQVIAFDFEIDDAITREIKPGRKRGKVYRMAYSIQPERIEGQYTDNTLYAKFKQPYQKDVTMYYKSVDRVDIRLNDTGEYKYAYLSIFDGRNYEAVDATTIENGKVTFNYVEPGIIYQITYRQKGRFIPASYPFRLDSLSVHFFCPDKQKNVRVRLNRKFPDWRVKGHMQTAIGARIEGANKRDFSDAILLHQVVDTPRINYNVVFLPEDSRFRYVRYKSSNERILELAELGTYKDTLVQGKWQPVKVETDTVLLREEMEKLQAVNDDDWVSFYKSIRKGSEVVLDYGKPISISSLVYIPRNDDNYVRMGDTYELLYHDGQKGWRTLGKQKAVSSSLIYENVPDNALLWLRNHTRGKEERAFYYEYDRQIFP